MNLFNMITEVEAEKEHDILTIVEMILIEEVMSFDTFETGEEIDLPDFPCVMSEPPSNKITLI